MHDNQVPQMCMRTVVQDEMETGSRDEGALRQRNTLYKSNITKGK